MPIMHVRSLEERRLRGGGSGALTEAAATFPLVASSGGEDGSEGGGESAGILVAGLNRAWADIGSSWGTVLLATTECLTNDTPAQSQMKKGQKHGARTSSVSASPARHSVTSTQTD